MAAFTLYIRVYPYTKSTTVSNRNKSMIQLFIYLSIFFSPLLFFIFRSVELNPNFISVEETKWIFDELKSQIPWQEKNIKVQGNH